ncbi:MAG: hypothetical protein H3C31_07475 [Brumimicrobium sp.]|nr:hypothetical protein [Brumimicrobium sp.]
MKKVKWIYVILCCIYASLLSAQEINDWKLVHSYSNKNISAWDVNPLSQIILASHSKIFKLDTNFQITFTQSDASFGNVSILDAAHSLKTLAFSENNQMLGILDNALTFQEGKADMSYFQISSATFVCYSEQSQRFWIYDEDNSRLVCFQGVKSNQKQSEITNVSGITGNVAPTSLLEKNHQLFLFYQGDGVFLFDYYGSLIRKYEEKQAIQIYPTDKFIYLLYPEYLVRLDRETDERKEVTLPTKGIQEFRVMEKFVFFKDKSGIKKYYLKE